MKPDGERAAEEPPPRLPACGGCLIWDQSLPFFSGCIQSVFHFFPLGEQKPANCCRGPQKRLRLISDSLLTSSAPRAPPHKSAWRSPTTRRACRTSVPLLCIKDETRWQITVARAALNPPIVFQRRCPVIYSRRLAPASVFGLFHASFTESITFTHKNMTLGALVRARPCVSGRKQEMGRAETGMDGWMDGGTDG